MIKSTRRKIKSVSRSMKASSASQMRTCQGLEKIQVRKWTGDLIQRFLVCVALLKIKKLISMHGNVSQCLIEIRILLKQMLFIKRCFNGRRILALIVQQQETRLESIWTRFMGLDLWLRILN